MTLTQFLAALKNSTMVVTVLDNDGTELVKLYPTGYQQLLTTLLAREVTEVEVKNMQSAIVKLAAE
jgi:hypothetical protein